MMDGISPEARHAAASQEVSARLSLRNTCMFAFISISIAIFGIVFTSNHSQFSSLLLLIPFAGWGTAMLYRYHDETLGILSLFMCELELQDYKVGESYWNAQKGDWQTVAHNRGGRTLRRAQYLIFIGIPASSVIIWSLDNFSSVFSHYSNAVFPICSFLALIFSAKEILQSTRFRKKLSNNKKMD